MSNFVKFLGDRETFCQLPSTFRVARGPSVSFCPLSVKPSEFLSTFVNFKCSQDMFRQLSPAFFATTKPSINFRKLFVLLGDLPSNSVQQGTFSQLPVNFPSSSVGFRVTCILFVNFCKLPALPRDHPSTLVNSLRPGDFPSTFLVAGRPSVNFCQFLARSRDLPSNFIKFSLWPENLPSNSVNFKIGPDIFSQFPSRFHAASSPSVNFSCSG